MRSFVFLCHKGNILAFLKELLVENPLSLKGKFGPKRVNAILRLVAPCQVSYSLNSDLSTLHITAEMLYTE